MPRPSIEKFLRASLADTALEDAAPAASHRADMRRHHADFAGDRCLCHNSLQTVIGDIKSSRVRSQAAL
jgi:hypothetical protein